MQQREQAHRRARDKTVRLAAALERESVEWKARPLRLRVLNRIAWGLQGVATPLGVTLFLVGSAAALADTSQVYAGPVDWTPGAAALALVGMLLVWLGSIGRDDW